MIILKSADELEAMRRAGRIVAGTIDRVVDAVAPLPRGGREQSFPLVVPDRVDGEA